MRRIDLALTAKVKPCPFCGAKAEMRVEKRSPEGFHYTPRCTVTGCCGRLSKKYTDNIQATFRWNKRVAEVK